MAIPISQCRVCGNTHIVTVLSLGDQHLTGVFPKSTSQHITSGPLSLVKCIGENNCGLVQLSHSYDSGEMYGENYGYRSGLNQTMVSHLKSKVSGLLRNVSLAETDIVLDIGSNDGTLLSFYPENITRIGMDPTSAKFRQFYKPGIEVVTDFFSAAEFRQRFGSRNARIITSIAMFYDLKDPNYFVEQVSEILADDGVWHFEQSYLPSMLATNAYDTVCHEHLEYYGLKQIQWVLDRSGLKIIDVELNDTNGGSFAVTAAKANSSIPRNLSVIERILAEEEEIGLSTLAPYESFSERVFKHRDELLATIRDLTARGKKIFGYGASTKGNVILQFCGLSSKEIPFIAEVNPEKFGSYTPGTCIPIISEADAHAMNPDYLLVLPWHFRKNLIEREQAFLQQGGGMIFPLPQIEIVRK